MQIKISGLVVVLNGDDATGGKQGERRLSFLGNIIITKNNKDG